MVKTVLKYSLSREIDISSNETIRVNVGMEAEVLYANLDEGFETIIADVERVINQKVENARISLWKRQ
jgi:hypothetical protein